MSENQKKLDRLKKRVGAGIFQQIMDEFSGEKIYFSFAGETDARDRSIQADYDAGLSIDDICDKYQLSRSRVYDLIRIRR